MEASIIHCKSPSHPPLLARKQQQQAARPLLGRNNHLLHHAKRRTFLDSRRRLLRPPPAAIADGSAASAALLLGVEGPATSGDYSVFITIGALLFFVYWIANFVVPDMITKDLQSGNPGEKTQEGTNTTLERQVSLSMPGKSRQKKKKAKGSFKQRSKP